MSDDLCKVRDYVLMEIAVLRDENAASWSGTVREWNKARIEVLEDVLNFIEAEA